MAHLFIAAILYNCALCPSLEPSEFI